MPPGLTAHYPVVHTQASPQRLRGAGYAGQFTPLEEGVRRYVQDHLMTSNPYL